MTFNHFIVGGGLLLIWVYVKRRQDNANRPPLPPSPPRDPIIGHARYIPLVNQETYFYELGQQYGGIVHLDVLGKSLVVLNKVQPAVDILEKRGALFSGRPFNPLADIMGISKMLVLMDYDEKWRTHRRLMQSYLVKEKVQSLQNRATWQNIAKTMVAKLVSKTDKWQQSMMLFSTSVIIEYGYGHRIKDENDPYLKLAHNFCEHVVPQLRAPDGALVDIMPYARHLPAWLPGNSIVGEATVASQYVNDFANYPLKDTAKRMAEGIARSSFLVDHLEAHQSKTLNITIEEITSLSTMLFVGGAETTSTTLSIFLAAMVKFPEWQLKAQAEIDRVIGSDCLPNFLDRANLPMVECIMQETMRWQPALPFGVPHQSTDDDIYEGMFIPKNSVIVPNIRGMALDHEVYQDPFNFNPSRFLPKPEGLGEPHFAAAFGFGRRVCVGKHLADDIVWVAIATMLASLSIKRPIGEDGKEYCPEIEFVYGPTCITKPFKCRIEPRNESMKAMIAEHTAEL